MTQTTGAISWRNSKVEMSVNGSSWTDISGFETAVAISGGDRQSAVAFTSDGDTGIITAAKREPIDVEANVLYTEGASEAFEVYRAAYEAGSPFYLRWSPKGGSTGQFQFTTPAGLPISQPYPGGQAGNAEALAFNAKIQVSSVTKAVVA